MAVEIPTAGLRQTPTCSDPVDADTGFNGGDGTSASSPFLICSYDQLGLMADELGAHYRLGDNIDASAENWTPLGDATNNFEGSLDGGSYVISNLTVEIDATGNQYGGLFGYTGGSAKISNVGLEAINISVTSSGGANGNTYAGGLVGYNYGGSIRNSYAQGSVTSSVSAVSVTAVSYGGGLVGVNDGSITNSYAQGSASASASGYVTTSHSGGLVGYNYGGSIRNSYAQGSVTSSVSAVSVTAVSNSGGLVGRSAGSITNSYASGLCYCYCYYYWYY